MQKYVIVKKTYEDLVNMVEPRSAEEEKIIKSLKKLKVQLDYPIEILEIESPNEFELWKKYPNSQRILTAEQYNDVKSRVNRNNSFAITQYRKYRDLSFASKQADSSPPSPGESGSAADSSEVPKFSELSVKIINYLDGEIDGVKEDLERKVGVLAEELEFREKEQASYLETSLSCSLRVQQEKLSTELRILIKSQIDQVEARLRLELTNIIMELERRRPTIWKWMTRIVALIVAPFGIKLSRPRKVLGDGKRSE